MSESPVEVVKRLYDAFARADVDAVLACVDPDVRWSSPESMPWAQVGDRGHEAVRAYFEVMGEHLEGARIGEVQYLQDGEWVVAFGYLPGRARATGKPFNARVAHLWQVRDVK